MMGIRRFASRAVVSASLVFVTIAATAQDVPAADGTTALREVSGSGDFRVRVNAALVLGRLRPAGARDALEHSLGDGHPAVRAASAEALASLGDPSALTALAQRAAVEPSPSVKAQIRVTMDSLRAAGDGATVDGPAGGLAPDVQYVIALGAMRNNTGVRGDELSHVLSDAARARTHSFHGACVSGGDASLLRQAAVRHVPVITLDGNLAQIVESRVAGSVQVHARVEFTVRRDQTLKGTVSGAATTFGSGAAISAEARRKLQNDAVEGAVQSALRGAEEGLIVAAR